MKIVSKQFLTMLVTIGLIFVPALQGQQIQKSTTAKTEAGTPAPVLGNGPPPKNPGAGGPTVPASLSLAVAQTMQSKMVTLANNIQNNTVTATNYSAAATALQAYFANEQETGFTANIQAWILANKSLFTSASPTTAQLEAGYAELQAAGVVTTYGQYVTSITGVSAANREAFLTAVSTTGLVAYEASVVQNLETISSQVTRHGGTLIQVAGCHLPLLSVGGLWLGIVALAVTGPVGIAIAVTGLALGGAGLVTGC